MDKTTELFNRLREQLSSEKDVEVRLAALKALVAMDEYIYHAETMKTAILSATPMTNNYN